MVNSASSDLSFARAQSGYILMYVPHFFALCKRRRLRRPVSSFLVETQEAFRTCTRSGGSGANGRVFGGLLMLVVMVKHLEGYVSYGS